MFKPECFYISFDEECKVMAKCGNIGGNFSQTLNIQYAKMPYFRAVCPKPH